MKFLTHLITVAFLAFFLGRCSEIINRLPTSQVRYTTASGTLSIPTEMRRTNSSGSSTSMPTEVPILKLTPTSNDTSTPSITPIPKPMAKNCIEITEDKTLIGQLEGKLVLDYPGIENPSYTFSFDTRKLTPILPSEISDSLGIAVSPNGKLLLLQTRTTNKGNSRSVILLDMNKKLHREIPVEAEWGIRGWLDNEQIVAEADWPEKPYDWWPSMTIIINPYTNVVEKFPPNYPDFYVFQVHWYPTLAVYEPTLTRVLYPTKESDEEKVGYIVLWDIVNGQALVRIPAMLSRAPEPVWSPNGEFAIIAGLVDPNSTRENHDFFLVNRDGVTKRLTYFSDQPPITYFRALAISPDSRSVAFLVWDFNDSIESLAMLDISTGKVTNTCIGGDLSGRHTSRTPIWSPDGRYLLIEQLFVKKNHSRVLVIDTIQKKAFIIVENMIPVGWMTSSP